MSSKSKNSLRQMLAALDGEQKKRLAAATDGVEGQRRTQLTRYVAFRLLTESRRAELAIARKLEGQRHA